MPARPLLLAIVVTLSLLVARTAAAADAKPDAPKPVAKDLKIVVDGEKVTVNGKTITLPADPADVIAVLGPPDREANLANRILTWDGLGVLAYVTKKEPAKVRQLTVALGRDTLKFWPAADFAGTLTVDGAAVTAASTVEEINKAKAGAKFAADKLMPNTPAIEHENVLVTLNPAKPDPAKPDAAKPAARLVALSVDARLAKKAAAGK